MNGDRKTNGMGKKHDAPSDLPVIKNISRDSRGDSKEAGSKETKTELPLNSNVSSTPRKSSSQILENTLDEELSDLTAETSNRGLVLKIVFIVAVVILIVVLVGGGVFAYQRFVKRAPKTAKQETPTQTGTASIPEGEEDVDGDGFSNAREAELGTNYQMPDTDLDGLGDKEEVEKYQTDPKNKDSDGDGFFDGAEVKNGFNPKGSGKLEK